MSRYDAPKTQQIVISECGSFIELHCAGCGETDLVDRGRSASMHAFILSKLPNVGFVCVGCTALRRGVPRGQVIEEHRRWLEAGGT